MKPFFLATTAIALLGCTLSAYALEKPDRKIVITCSTTHRLTRVGASSPSRATGVRKIPAPN